jgi:hypothetical protein
VLLLGFSSDVYLECTEANPLQMIYLAGAKGQSMKVYDGNGREYYQADIAPHMQFRAGGDLVKHSVMIFDRKNRILDELSFHVDASTKVDDHGYYSGIKAS